MSLLTWMKETADEQGVQMEPLPKYGDHMTIAAFERRCKSGLFINYDGHGNYATETECSNQIVQPSDVEAGRLDRNWTHVVWFNR